MNIPQIYLVEPYNAYAPKGRKKHWMEIAEEEALIARIVAEQQALLQQQNLALISQTPPPSSQQVQDSSTVSPIPGAGGQPAYVSLKFWNSDLTQWDTTDEVWGSDYYNYA